MLRRINNYESKVKQVSKMDNGDMGVVLGGAWEGRIFLKWRGNLIVVGDTDIGWGDGSCLPVEVKQAKVELLRDGDVLEFSSEST